MKKLKEVWDYLKGRETLVNIADVQRGKLPEKIAKEMRKQGVCVLCKKFIEEALIHESPGTAKCCKDCVRKEIPK